MPIKFTDRAPSKPGRVRITPENGSSPYFATMERADEPRSVGTPLTAANLNKAQETLVFTNDESVSTYKQVFVSTTGNDNNSGETSAEPMATIKGVIRKYAMWYKMLDIYLADGTYNENIGNISVDQCNLSIRSASDNKEAVTINMSEQLETHLQLLRLYNITLNVTSSTVRGVSVYSGVLYASGVRITLPADSTANAVNAYYGSSVWLTDCILNSGTSSGAAVYGNQALHMKAVDCTSERTLSTGFYANYGTNIEYTPTLTAKTLARESNKGKCILVSDRPGALEKTMGSLYGSYKTADGLLIQWGTVTITPTAVNTATPATITFPMPFAETPVVTATVATTVPQNVSLSIMRGGDGVSDNKREAAIIITRNGATATGVNWMAVGKGVV